MEFAFAIKKNQYAMDFSEKKNCCKLLFNLKMIVCAMNDSKFLIHIVHI